MKKQFGVIVLGLTTMAALVLSAGCSAPASAGATAAAPTASVPAAVRADGNVTAEGKLVPQRSARVEPAAGRGRGRGARARG